MAILSRVPARQRIWALALTLAAVLLVGRLALGPEGPRPPSFALLARWGFTVHPLAESVPVTAAEAEAEVRRAFPPVHAGAPIHAELVLVQNSHIPTLKVPVAAWLLTWDQTGYPAGGPGQGPPFHHLNEFISAVSGKMLVTVPTP